VTLTWPGAERQCKFGITDDELRERLGEQYDAFIQWMSGQTVAVCDGRYYNQLLKTYTATHCGPHGTVVYEHDVVRFEQGLPIID
jgi:hypothetical protein